MIFLIEYDRSAGNLVSITEFDSADRASASKARLELEINLLISKTAREVVLLEARSENDLRKTHGRYFSKVKEIAGSVSKASKIAPYDQ